MLIVDIDHTSISSTFSTSIYAAFEISGDYLEASGIGMYLGLLYQRGRYYFLCC